MGIIPKAEGVVSREEPMDSGQRPSRFLVWGQWGWGCPQLDEWHRKKMTPNDGSAQELSCQDGGNMRTEVLWDMGIGWDRVG